MIYSLNRYLCLRMRTRVWVCVCVCVGGVVCAALAFVLCVCVCSCDWIGLDWIDDRLYSAILRSLEQTHCARMWCYSEWLAFYSAFLNIYRSGVLTALAWLVPHETAAVSAQVLCTPYNHEPCHFMQSHIHKVYACLTVTCHLHFWQNDRDLLLATAVTRGWNGYRIRVSTDSRPWRRNGAHLPH